MQKFIHGLLLAAAPCAIAAAQPVFAADASAASTAGVPQGLLPDVATPVDYRLNFVILPGNKRFSGHTEIDVDLKAPTKSLYMHGRDLNVSLAQAVAAGKPVGVTYTQVDPLGVVRLDFASELPAGRITLKFDYDAAFSEGSASLFHVKVDNIWYAWTQFESIDARGAFPGFDQPGYKTPFTVTVATAAGDVAYNNSAEVATKTFKVDPNSAAFKFAKAAGEPLPAEMTNHVFATTKPLPTYLVAFGAGPFSVATGTAAPSPQRKEAMAIRIIGTHPNKDKMDFALQNTGPIVDLLENYFGRPFPFPKLDQIGTPILGGAMENAGADTYNDSLLFLDSGASTGQKQGFGIVVSHELAHQWFGDLVTPKWWDDIWLNESFANWMGYRIGNEWRPDLKIGYGAIGEAFRAMGTDALKAGRPIHQPIATNGEIDSAFDSVTYGKGGQVVAMIAAYLGDEKFRDGVRLHLNRHAYGNATTEEFFQSLAEAAKDPRVVDAMKSFVDQQGVPVVHVERGTAGLTISQKRYAMLGTDITPKSWIIPVCVTVGDARKCQLLDKASDSMAISGTGSIMPNAGGTGYYRFSMAETEWRKLIADAAKLSPGEALALNDSLWAAFRAGEVSPDLLVAAAKAMTGNSYSVAAVEGGSRLAGLRSRGLIPDSSLSAYRATLTSIYGPMLKALGSDPKAGAYAADEPDKQQMRSSLIGLLASEGEDAALRASLSAAAKAFIAGDKTALDQSLYGVAFGALVATEGQAAAQSLFEYGVKSENSRVRGAALGAVGGSGSTAISNWAIGKLTDSRLRPSDKLNIVGDMTSEPATRDLGFGWILANYDAQVKDNGIFVASRIPNYASGYCSVAKASEIEKLMRPKVDKFHRGSLELDRVTETVNDCGVLQQARGGQIAAALTKG